MVYINHLTEPEDEIRGSQFLNLETAQKVSVARVARVSYESFETGKRSTVEEDLKLYDRLAKSGHWSPFEHQATPDAVVWNKTRGDVTMDWTERAVFEHLKEHGNFKGWRQYRQMLPGQAVAPLPEEFL